MNFIKTESSLSDSVMVLQTIPYNKLSGNFNLGNGHR